MSLPKKCEFCRGELRQIKREEKVGEVSYTWEEGRCRRCNSETLTHENRELRLRWLAKREPSKYRGAQELRVMPKGFNNKYMPTKAVVH